MRSGGIIGTLEYLQLQLHFGIDFPSVFTLFEIIDANC
jgi:hypothetical protein